MGQSKDKPHKIMVREEKRRRGEDVKGGGRYMGDRRRERD